MIPCPRFESLLDAYVDERLAPDDRREVDHHLEGCAACRAVVDELRDLARVTAQLPRGIPPERDLWPELSKKIDLLSASNVSSGHVRSVHLGIWAAAAAAMLILGLALTITLTDRSTPVDGQAYSAAHLEAFREAERQYLEATRQLLATLENRRSALPPASVTAVEENLQIIDQAIDEVRLALDVDPEDRRNGHLMTALYRRKLELLWRVSRLSS